MQFHKKFGRVAKGGGGAWTQLMHPLYIPSLCQRPPVQVPPPSKDPYSPPDLGAKNMERFVKKHNLLEIESILFLSFCFSHGLNGTCI
jgi:hypothetical protein